MPWIAAQNTRVLQVDSNDTCQTGLLSTFLICSYLIGAHLNLFVLTRVFLVLIGRPKYLPCILSCKTANNKGTYQVVFACITCNGVLTCF